MPNAVMANEPSTLKAPMVIRRGCLAAASRQADSHFLAIEGTRDKILDSVLAWAGSALAQDLKKKPRLGAPRFANGLRSGG